MMIMILPAVIILNPNVGFDMINPQTTVMIKRINALTAPVLSSRYFLAKKLSAYPAKRGDNTRPKFHPKISK